MIDGQVIEFAVQCCYCHKYKDEGIWKYIAIKPVAVSHSICPDCIRKYINPFRDGGEPIVFKDGVPCPHPGCLNHIKTECEVCGRTAARGIAHIHKSKLSHIK